ncbi:P-selectin-like [Lingula anatina]|uniref:P-selectin-like n=1 Tax=Lingula anatina TaxID=7574 RepID=A0A1S3GYT9_LINAN|nr:P-selectin-like [Lingula anatina]XP_013379040.1 P-selectin-like [Lingula anatina]|eukprot:XP_013379039.1 P-selectin-like [Lingula anatina]
MTTTLVTFSEHSCEDRFSYQCQQVTAPCGASPNIAMATKVYSQCSSNCCFVGGQINYTCQAGYQLTGFEGSITCNSDGNYSVDASVGTCVALSCSNYTLNSNNHVTGNDTSGSYVYGTVIEFTCEDGYELVGGGGATTKLVRCNASGARVDWDSTVPTCQAFSCSNYTLNSNNHVTGNDTSGSYVYGTVIEFTCEDGYELVGGGGATTKLVRCSASGAGVDWDSTVPTCQAQFSGKHRKLTSTTSGSILEGNIKRILLGAVITNCHSTWQDF